MLTNLFEKPWYFFIISFLLHTTVFVVTAYQWRQEKIMPLGVSEAQIVTAYIAEPPKPAPVPTVSKPPKQEPTIKPQPEVKKTETSPSPKVIPLKIVKRQEKKPIDKPQPIKKDKVIDKPQPIKKKKTIDKMQSTKKAVPLIQKSKGEQTTALKTTLHAAIEKQKHYPDSAAQMQREGRVTVSFVLHPNGTTQQLTVLTSSGTNSLDAAALDAVRKATPFPNINQYLDQPREYKIDIVFKL